ncbi:MAG: DUF512 domain-containing protein [Actinomycetia bacterium]|nr:DUF512 domain-containing protein [Actinomycetes bacterium]
MAISTPAQKPRGAASRTRSTFIALDVSDGGNAADVTGGPILQHVQSRPRIVAIVEGSVASKAGLVIGDEIASIDGEIPRDVIAWQQLVDEPDIELELDRGGLNITITVEKQAGEPLGAEVDAALFDRVRTCDNHCAFCFIYQLPKGLRRSLYLKDDDYRLSFLYGNFTTLTRFTEADLERVISEGLSPLYVSIHATDPDVRATLLRNRRGAMSLRWLRALLDHGIEVHGQLVICPGINDGVVLDDTLRDVLDLYPELASVAAVPLGVSLYSNEPTMRPHTTAEAEAVVDIVESWQPIFVELLGRPMVHAADEYYLLADRPFPDGSVYGGFDMYEDGIGMARAFEREFRGHTDDIVGVQSGFFDSVDGAPAEGYRAQRTAGGHLGGVDVGPRVFDDLDSEAFGGSGQMVEIGSKPSVRRAEATSCAVPDDAPIVILTGEYGARVLGPLIDDLGRTDVSVLAVENRFFGGNVAVAGLLTGSDLNRVLQSQPELERFLLPDVCLTGGRFLDGLTPDDLARPVEVIATDGVSLREALGRRVHV